MKKMILLLTTLIMLSPCRSFSQDQKEPVKTLVKPALLVIDIQNTYLQWIPGSDKEMALAYINYLIELFRSNDCPVIRIYHYDKGSGPEPGTAEFEFPASVPVKNDDARVVKTYADAFNKTDLDKVIKEKGCNTLFLCGLSAVGCVLATWHGAQNHDYKAFLVKEALMSHNAVYTDNVEEMFDAVSYDMVKFIVEHAAK